VVFMWACGAHLKVSMLEESGRHHHPSICWVLMSSLEQTFSAPVRISPGGREGACNMGSHQLGDAAQCPGQHWICLLSSPGTPDIKTLGTYGAGEGGTVEVLLQKMTEPTTNPRGALLLTSFQHSHLPFSRIKLLSAVFQTSCIFIVLLQAPFSFVSLVPSGSTLNVFLKFR